MRNIKNQIIIILLFCLYFSAAAFGANTKATYNQKIQSYVIFLQKQTVDPVDYIMNLFNKYDIVILGERDHEEMTQWDLIYKLVSDPRFLNQVGNIFTEYNSVTQQKEIDDFLNASTLDKTKALDLMRNQPIWPEGRDDNNYYNFLLKVYPINHIPGYSKKIHIYPSDVPWQWDHMTPQFYQSYETYEDTKGNLQMSPDAYSRDRRMALRIYFKYQEIAKSSSSQKKILVVMNTRHARGYMKILDESPYAFLGQNVAGCLISWLPGKVANVFINTYTFDQNHNPAPVIDGKWDAAFAVIGNKSLGFNLKDSPFGEDKFFPQYNYTYQDLYTGMIFYIPLNKQMLDNDIPGFYSNDFVKIVNTRSLLIGENYWKSVEQQLNKRKTDPKSFGLRRLIDEPGFENIMKEIDYWLNP